MLIVARLLEFVGSLGDNILYVLPDEIGLECQLGLLTLERFGVGRFSVLEILSFGHHFVLLGHHLFYVLDGLANGFFFAAFGREQAHEFNHAAMGVLLVTSCALDGFALEISGRAIEGGFQIGLHLCQRLSGAMLFGAGEFFVELLKKRSEDLSFIIDADLVELLNAQVNLDVFAVGVGIGASRFGDHFYGALKVAILGFSEALIARGKGSEFLLQLPVEINLLERNDDLFLTGKSADGILAGALRVGVNDLRGLELLHHAGHFGAGKLVKHPAETPQRVNIVALQTVTGILGNHRVELARHALKANADVALLHFLPEKARVGFLGGRGYGQKRRANHRKYGNEDDAV